MPNNETIHQKFLNIITPRERLHGYDLVPVMIYIYIFQKVGAEEIKGRKKIEGKLDRRST